MKLDDFTPIDNGDDKIWKKASQDNLIAIMTSGGKTYQLKIHAEPKWYYVDDEIRRKEEELRACNEEDRIRKKDERLASELDSLRRAKPKRDENDKIADAYLSYKQRLTNAVKSLNDSHIICASDFWKQPIDFKGDVVLSIDASAWLDTDVGFENKPILFGRDLNIDQQYEVVASLADTLAKLHNAGIVHSDLKIGNVLLAKRDGKLGAVLIDFDCGILLDDLHRRRVPFEALRMLVGGTHYSPELQELFNTVVLDADKEQYDAFDLSRITPKSDIFSLAVTIYEFFYGRADFTKLMPMVAPDGEMIDAPMYGYAVSLGYKPAFPDSMDDLLYSMLNWMLELKPEDRPTAEEVAKVFRSKDTSIIPSKYLRNPLWEEHRGIYELTLPEGYAITHGTKPYYRFTKNGSTWFTRSIKELVNEHLAKVIGAPSAEDEHKLWAPDGDKDLPFCAKRANQEGKYSVKFGDREKVVDFTELKRLGVICPEEDLRKPWPDDDIRFVSAKKITRDMRRGVGCYIAGEGIGRSFCTTEQLLKGGYAVKSSEKTPIKIMLWPKDEEIYCVNPDADTTNVASIVRNTLMGKGYRVFHTSGSPESLDAEGMFRKGFFKKK